MTAAKVLIPLIALVCLMPFVPAPVALVSGITLALTLGNPYFARTWSVTHRMLALSVMGLGAGMDLQVVGKVGMQGLGYTIVGIALTMALGLLLGSLLRTARAASILISAGTAICGGSAIAAVAPVIRAEDHDVSVALGTVFLLNSVALFAFPPIGHALGLSETQFGLWGALAIHDTSSVVGAMLSYGPKALEVGTTVKLARALWIVPLTLGMGLVAGKNSGSAQARPRRPWFILGFIACAALVTWVPGLRPAGHLVELAARRGLVLTLFLIGLNLTRARLVQVGLRPLVQGFLLWATVSATVLGAVVAQWIH